MGAAALIAQAQNSGLKGCANQVFNGSTVGIEDAFVGALANVDIEKKWRFRQDWIGIRVALVYWKLGTHRLQHSPTGELCHVYA